MSARIWPGAPCYLVRPWSIDREVGLVVTAMRRGTYGETVFTRRGGLSSHSHPISGWLCDGPGDGFPCFVAEVCLLPILPPPDADTTEDRAPCELQPGEIVGV